MWLDYHIMVDDEPATQPDVMQLKCPQCGGSGDVLVGYDRGVSYLKKRMTCDLCWGKKFITRDAFDRWRARQ
jgi:DnaJ-class molecular chaperone